MLQDFKKFVCVCVLGGICVYNEWKYIIVKEVDVACSKLRCPYLVREIVTLLTSVLDTPGSNSGQYTHSLH